MPVANTSNISTIQILRSYANSAPTTLVDGQLAFSFVSNTLFIGSNTGGVIAISDQATANLARQLANTIIGIQGVDNTQNTNIAATDGKMQSAYSQANTSTVLAQAAYNQANVTVGVDATQNTNIQAAWNTANSAYALANTETLLGGWLANTILVANSTGYLANSNAFFTASNNTLTINNGGLTANGRIIVGNQIFNANIANVLNVSVSSGNSAIRAINLVDSAAVMKIVRSGNNPSIELQQWDATLSTLQGYWEAVAVANNFYIRDRVSGASKIRLAIDPSGNITFPTVTSTSTSNNTGAMVVPSLGVTGNINSDYVYSGGYFYKDGTPITNTANNALSNTIIIQGVDVGQNARMTIIEGTDVSQNVRLDYSNTAITIIQGVDVTQNAAIAATDNKMASAYNQANTGTVLAQGAFNQSNASFLGVNTAITIIQGTDTSQNARMTIIEGVDVTQNAATAATNQYATSAFSTANNAYTKANNALANTTGTFAGTLTVTGNVIANSFITSGSSGNISGANFVYANTFVASNSYIFPDGTVQTSAASASLASGAYNQANTATVLAQAAYNQANVTIGVDTTQNSRMTIIEGTDVSQNARMVIIEGVNASQNVRLDYSNAAITIIQGTDTSQNARMTIIEGVDFTQNTNISNKLSLTGALNQTVSGNVTISQDLIVAGNLILTGNINSQNVQQLAVADPLILLGLGNYVSDTKDIGFAAHYNDGTNAHAGLIRDSGTKEFYVFQGYTPEVDANNNVIITDPSFRTANLNASYVKGNLIATTAVVNGNIPSTSTTTGSLIVTGGAGVSGNLWSQTINAVGGVNGLYGDTNFAGQISGNLYFVNKTYYTNNNGNLIYFNHPGAGWGTISVPSANTFGLSSSNQTIPSLLWGFQGTNIANGFVVIPPSSNLAIQNTYTSTSNTTGALTVAGGLGVAGNAYFSGNVTVANTSTGVNTLQISQGYYTQETYIGITNSSTYGSIRYNINPGSGGAGHFFTTYGSPTSQGVIQFAAIATAGGSAVNYLQASGNTTTNSPTLTSVGTDNSVALTLQTKNANTFVVIQDDNSAGTSIPNTGLWITGQRTGLGRVSLKALGAMYLSPYGGNSLWMTTGASSAVGNDGVTQATVTHTASAVNYLQVSGNTTGNGPTISAQGSDSNVDVNLVTKGIGYTNFNNVAGTHLKVGSSSPTALTGYVSIAGDQFSRGVITGVSSLVLTSSSTGSVSLQTNSTAQQQFVATHTASAVNYLQVTGAATLGQPVLSAQGSDANIGITIQAKGVGTANGTAIFFSKSTSTSSSGRYEFGNVGGLSSDYAGGYWRGLHISAPSYTMGGSAVYPRMVMFFESDSYTDPTVKNYYNALSSSSANVWTYVISNNTGPYGGNIDFRGQAVTGSDVSFRVASNTSSINYLQVSGNTTGNAPTLTSVGSDANVNFNLVTQGSGTFSFLNNNYNSAIIFNRNIPINEWTITANNISNLGLAATGGGSIYFYTSTSNAQRQFSITQTVSAVNYVQVTGGTTGNNPTLSSVGSDSTVGMNFIAKNSNLYFYPISSGATSNLAVVMVPATNAVNYAQLSGAATGSGPSLVWTGTDLAVVGVYNTKGAGAHYFATNNNQQFRISDTASAVNYLQVTGAVTGGAPYVLATGSDADVPLILSSKGIGSILFKTAGVTPTQFAVTHTASAVNYVQVTGNATGQQPYFLAAGSDGSIGITYATKGTGAHFFSSGGGNYYQFNISNTNSAVNYLQVTGGTANGPNGNGASISVQGSSTDADMYLTAKGNGRINVASKMIVGNAAVATYYSVIAPYDGLIVANTSTGGAIGFGGINGRSLSAYQNGALSNFDMYAAQTYYAGDLLVQGQIKTPNSTSANLRITTTDANATIFIDRTVYIANANSSISNATGALILAGGMGITGNLFMSAANNYYTSTGSQSYRLGWTDNYFSRNPVYNGMDFYGNYLNINPQFITTGALSIRNIVNNDSGNNTIIFSGQSGLLIQNGASVAVNVGGGAVIGTSSANYLQISGNTTGNAPTISAQGSDSNIDLRLVSKGSGVLNFNSQYGREFMVYTFAGTPVNYWSAVGNGAGAAPYLYAQGSDSSVDGKITAKGVNGTIRFQSNGGTADQLVVSPTTSSVNYLQVTGNTTGGGPTISAQGSDTNIDLVLFPKANGNVRVIGSSTVSRIHLRTFDDNYNTLIETNYDTTQGLNIYNTNNLVLRHGSVTGLILNYVNGNTNFQYRSTSQLSINGANNQVTVLGPIVVQNTAASISNTTGALIVSGGMGITGNVFLSTANNFATTTFGQSYRLGWTDNYFSRDLRYGGVQFLGNYLSLNATGGSVSVENGTNFYVRSNISNDSGNNVVLFAGTSQVKIQNGTASSNTTTGALVVQGGVGISGALNATTKSFNIPHPTKEGKDLRYGSLEGPEFGVYIRGTLKGSDTIELPDYWTKLVDANTITVSLTPIGKYQKLSVKKVKDNTIIINNDGWFRKEIHCYYTVFGERADVDKLDVEG